MGMHYDIMRVQVYVAYNQTSFADHHVFHALIESMHCEHDRDIGGSLYSYGRW